MLLVLLFLACAGAPCAVDGVEHPDGESWTCSDGCNTCTCENGAVASTLMACDVSCVDTTGTYEPGDSWTCPDGCNTCFCEPDGGISSTNMDCSI